MRHIALTMFSLEKRRLWGNLTGKKTKQNKTKKKKRAAFQYLKGVYKKAAEELFTRICSDVARGNDFKLKEGRFTLDIRKEFFTMRVMRHRHRLPREVVAVPSLAVFKARLDGALSNLV